MDLLKSIGAAISGNVDLGFGGSTGVGANGTPIVAATPSQQQASDLSSTSIWLILAVVVAIVGVFMLLKK